jgi:hypothetical protein
MISDLMPYTRKIADDISILRTVHTEHVNHDPASKFLHTGFQIAGRPSGGAWVNYALGSNNQDLPTFIVMSSGQANGVPIDAAAWGSGFLPSHYQGVLFRSSQQPVPYIGNPGGLTSTDRRAMLDAIADVANLQHQVSNDPEIPSKLSQYEMSYRMQTSVPQVADIPTSLTTCWTSTVRTSASRAPSHATVCWHGASPSAMSGTRWWCSSDGITTSGFRDCCRPRA